MSVEEKRRRRKAFALYLFCFTAVPLPSLSGLFGFAECLFFFFNSLPVVLYFRLVAALWSWHSSFSSFFFFFFVLPKDGPARRNRTCLSCRSERLAPSCARKTQLIFIIIVIN